MEQAAGSLDIIKRTGGKTSIEARISAAEDEQLQNTEVTTFGTGSGLGAVVKESRVSKKPSGKKRKKDRCHFSKCGSMALKFIGDCQFCEGHFCSKHRLMENHSCNGLRSCKEQMHQKNADKLAQEQTIVPKIQI
ncbi:HBR241Wp [Eremothecium sinecaudum]|uniref:HBR241Wp n=1 Tax=Eremothecium sinecaudum TaxID=45286 RepID=A0A120K196_9SACH|nr:HBR241Wp [Eremothecium sinecaudum]AMD19142.1 HBR241Wp [Eremothecium sinecaudum]